MRSFVSVDVSIMDSINELQNRIIIEEDWKTDQIRPVERRIFISPSFLGEISLETTDILKTQLSSLVFQPFTLIYKGLGVFPSIANPRIVWMGTDVEGEKNS